MKGKGNDRMDRENDQKELSEMDRTFSRRISVIRVFISIFAFLCWIIIGYVPTILLTSGIQGFMGTVSFFVRNPLTFLLVAFLNIFLGIFEYVFFGIVWWSAFHLIWSIRWFYGYFKYRKLDKI